MTYVAFDPPLARRATPGPFRSALQHRVVVFDLGDFERIRGAFADDRECVVGVAFFIGRDVLQHECALPPGVVLPLEIEFAAFKAAEFGSVGGEDSPHLLAADLLVEIVGEEGQEQVVVLRVERVVPGLDEIAGFFLNGTAAAAADKNSTGHRGHLPLLDLGL